MQNRHRKKTSAAGKDKHMNMHFQFRIKRRTARTDRETRNSKQIRDEHPGDRLYGRRETGNKNGEKDSARGGISFGPCRPDAA